MKKIRVKLVIRYVLFLMCFLLWGCGTGNQGKAQKVEEINQQEGSQTEGTQTEEIQTKDTQTEETQTEETQTDGTQTEDVQAKEAQNAEDIEGKEAGMQLPQEQTEVNQIQEKEVQSNEAAEESDEQTAAGEGTDMETGIIVYKGERRLELWQNGELTNSYHIGLGKNAEEKKEKEGDRKTPEGEYYVCTKNQYSKFYLSLGVSYPNIEDAKNGLENGLIDEETYETIKTAIQNGECPPWNTALGGEIMIHGHGGNKDWTKGCIAVDDEVMDVLWEACSIGTKIIIYP